MEFDDQALIAADRDGVIRVWSVGAERLLGHRAETAVGQSLDLVVPPDLRSDHWAGYHRAMASGTSQYDGRLFVDPMTHADGSVQRHRGRLYLLRGPDGSVAGALTVWAASEDDDGRGTAPQPGDG